MAGNTLNPSPLDQLLDAATRGLELFVDFKVAESEAEARRAQLQFEQVRFDRLAEQQRGSSSSPWGQARPAATANATAGMMPLILIGGGIALLVLALK